MIVKLKEVHTLSHTLSRWCTIGEKGTSTALCNQIDCGRAIVADVLLRQMVLVRVVRGRDPSDQQTASQRRCDHDACFG